jgi:hypothetical protein
VNSGLGNRIYVHPIISGKLGHLYIAVTMLWYTPAPSYHQNGMNQVSLGL